MGYVDGSDIDYDALDYAEGCCMNPDGYDYTNECADCKFNQHNGNLCENQCTWVLPAKEWHKLWDEEEAM